MTCAVQAKIEHGKTRRCADKGVFIGQKHHERSCCANKNDASKNKSVYPARQGACDKGKENEPGIIAHKGHKGRRIGLLSDQEHHREPAKRFKDEERDVYKAFFSYLHAPSPPDLNI